MRDAPWQIPPRRLATACTLVVVVLTVVGWFVSTWGVTWSGKLTAGIIDGIALFFAVPFVWIGTKLIADPSQTVQAADYASSSVFIDGHSHVVSRATGSSTVKFSRRGAIGFTCCGLVFYLGLMIVGVLAARARG